MKRKRQVPARVYTKKYYLEDCLGHELFAKTAGKILEAHEQALFARVSLSAGMRVLDLGCGRGDSVFYCARQGAEVIGIDYSSAGIALAKAARKQQPVKIQKRTKFICQDANRLPFADGAFDLVYSFDVFEHLYPEELERVVAEIYRVLVPGGKLLVHTEPNRWYLNFTHGFYVYPMSQFLIKLNYFLTHKDYPGLPADPRNSLHKVQHVNEPTVFSLRRVLYGAGFTGKISAVVSLLKPLLSWKDLLYNFVVLLYPWCLFPPLLYFFAYDYVCVMVRPKV